MHVRSSRPSLCSAALYRWLGGGHDARTDTLLRYIPRLGAFCALAVVTTGLLDVGIALPTPLLLAVCWLCWLSLTAVCGEFTAYPWDRLMCEVGALVLFLPGLHASAPAPAGGRATTWVGWLAVHTPPHAGVWFALQFLVFRVMLGMGKIKFDGVWWNEGCQYIRRFLWWQPLPSRLAYAMTVRAPDWLMATLLVGMFVAEMVLPFAIFFPCSGFLGPCARLSFAVATVLLQVGINLSGNYGIFNVLTSALAAIVVSAPPAASPNPSDLDFATGWNALQWLATLYSVLVGCMYFPSCSWCTSMWPYNDSMPSPCTIQRPLASTWWSFLFIWHRFPCLRPVRRRLFRFLRVMAPLRLVHGYGVFTVNHPIGKGKRSGLAIAGSHDGETWCEYEFRCDAIVHPRVGR